MNLNTTRDRLGSVGVRGVTAILMAATGGRCAVCADEVKVGAAATDPKRREVCHAKPAKGGKREGWSSANLFIGCGACNDWCGDRDVTSIIPSFRIPAGVATWTDAEARRAGKGVEVRKVSTDDHAAFRASLDALLPR